MSRVVYVDTVPTQYVAEIEIGDHKLIGDEPCEAGGSDAGPDPYELLMAALGTCTSITLRMYAGHRHWPLEGVQIVMTHAKVHAEDCVTCTNEHVSVDEIDMTITLKGDLSAQERQKLLEIADKCPVHRTLTSQVNIHTRLV